MSRREITLHPVTDELKGVREHQQVCIEQTFSRPLSASLLDDQVDQIRRRIGTRVEKAEHITGGSHAGGRDCLRDLLTFEGRTASHRFGVRSCLTNHGRAYAIQHSIVTRSYL